MNGYKEIQLAFVRPKLGDINVEIANRISIEFLPLGLVALHIRQSRDAMPLQTTMQGRARQLLGTLLRNTLPANGCGMDGCKA